MNKSGWRRKTIGEQRRAANENFVVKGEGFATSFSFHNTSFFAGALDFMIGLKPIRSNWRWLKKADRAVPLS